MKPFEDQTLIGLVMACCEDPTHPIEMLSDWIREHRYRDYMTGDWLIDDPVGWWNRLSRAGYQFEAMPRRFGDLLEQLQAIGTWSDPV